jgi:hypothetical protein
MYLIEESTLLIRFLILSENSARIANELTYIIELLLHENLGRDRGCYYSEEC